MIWFDTHTHLFDESLLSQIDEVVARAVEAGVTRMVVVGTNLAESRRAIELAEQHDALYAAVGIHPNYCAAAEESDLAEIEQLYQHAKVVGVGETGLDKYWDDSPFPLQQKFFAWHIAQSRAHGKPFIVHMRDCADDIAEMLAEAAKAGPLHGVMHSYTGDADLCRRCLDWGMYISFAGMVTFKKNPELREVAAMVPDDRLLIETDCPYLSPEPVRSKRPNEPAFMVHTAHKVAEVRGVSPERLAEKTTANALRMFGLA